MPKYRVNYAIEENYTEEIEATGEDQVRRIMAQKFGQFADIRSVELVTNLEPEIEE